MNTKIIVRDLRLPRQDRSEEDRIRLANAVADWLEENEPGGEFDRLAFLTDCAVLPCDMRFPGKDLLEMRT